MITKCVANGGDGATFPEARSAPRYMLVNETPKVPSPRELIDKDRKVLFEVRWS